MIILEATQRGFQIREIPELCFALDVLDFWGINGAGKLQPVISGQSISHLFLLVKLY